MYERDVSEYFTAKRKAAAQLGVDFKFQPQHLPSNREIRDEIQKLTQLYEGETRFANLRNMRLAALRMMRILEPFRPRLIGSVITGHVRKGSDIDIHLFSDSISAITDILDSYDYDYGIERKRIIKLNEERFFTHVHIEGDFPFELTMYPRNKVNYVFKSSITGKAIKRASIKDLLQLIEEEHPDAEIDNDMWQEC